MYFGVTVWMSYSFLLCKVLCVQTSNETPFYVIVVNCGSGFRRFAYPSRVFLLNITRQ